MHIILLKGPNGVGKDIFYSFLSRIFSKIVRFAFADVPKKMYPHLVDWSNRAEKERHRESFIEFCEGQKRLFGDDVWAKEFSNFLKGIDENNCEAIVITDLRFDVELEHVKSLGHHYTVFDLSRQDPSKLSINIDFSSLI